MSYYLMNTYRLIYRGPNMQNGKDRGSKLQWSSISNFVFFI